MPERQSNAVDDALVLGISCRCTKEQAAYVLKYAHVNADGPPSAFLQTIVDHVMVCLKRTEAASSPYSMIAVGPLPFMDVLAGAAAVNHCLQEGVLLHTSVDNDYSNRLALHDMGKLHPIILALAIPLIDAVSSSAACADFSLISGRLNMLSAWVNTYPSAAPSPRALRNNDIIYALPHKRTSLNEADMSPIAIKILQTFQSYATDNAVAGADNHAIAIHKSTLQKPEDEESKYYELFNRFPSSVQQLTSGSNHIIPKMQLTVNGLTAHLHSGTSLVPWYLMYLHKYHGVPIPMLFSIDTTKLDWKDPVVSLTLSMIYECMFPVNTTHPIVTWLEKYQYDKNRRIKDHSRYVDHTNNIKSTMVIIKGFGFGIDVKKLKIGKGVLYNFLSEGMYELFASDK